jgi:DNA-binding CsgD family transcriptional regulator
MARALSVVRAVQRNASGGVVWVSGPAGIGKSAFLGEVCRQAGRLGVRPAVGMCDPTEQVSPGAPVIAALRSGPWPLVPDGQIEQIVRALAEPLLAVERVASALEAAAAQGPILIAVDDVQWADRLSRFMVRALLSRLPGVPVMWLLASREDCAGLLARTEARVEHVRLTPLSSSDLAELARDRLGRCPDERTRRLLDASAGNPLLATRMLDGLVRAAARGDRHLVAEEFDAAIARQLADLPVVARTLVELVSVAERSVSVREVVQLSGRHDSAGGALRILVESGLLSMEGESLAPRHDLVREAVVKAMPDSSVRGLHRRFAKYHLARGRALSAGSHARAAAWEGDLESVSILIATAERLVGVNPHDASDLAVLAFRSVRPEQREWLGVGRRCLSVLCATQRAGAAVGMADLILAYVDDADSVGAVQSEAARALWSAGRLGEALGRVESAMSAGPGDPVVGARLTAARALALAQLSDDDGAASAASAALELARASGDRDAVATALRASGDAASGAGRHRQALRWFRELRGLTGPYQPAEEIMTLQFLDRYEHAQLLLDQVRPACAIGHASPPPALLCAQMWQEFNLGRSGEAEGTALELLDSACELGSRMYALDAIVVQIAVALLRGDVQGAAAQLVRAHEDLADTDEELVRPPLTLMRGWLAARQGDVGAAVALFGPLISGALSPRSWPTWPCWAGLLCEVGLARVDEGFERTVVQFAELAAARNPGVASFEGSALSVRGRSEGDLEMLAQGARVLGRSPRPILRAYGAEGYGRALLAAGRREAGLAQLDSAWDDYHRIDARVYRAGVEKVMREAGVRRAKWSATGRRPESGWESLTVAERRVALLIADGHTNRSAAGRLGVSVNTVGSHLRAAFAKLGVQSRVQLANAIREFSPA